VVLLTRSADLPRLLVEKGPDRGKSVTVVVGAQIVAGRDKDANLQLSDNMASRRHFLIASKGSIFGLKDLDSANGTLVNGRKAEGAHRLVFGDSIQVGETLISWLPDEQTDTQGGLIGQQIGGYRIEERLGRGAMGTVYKATQLSLGRTVALKVLAQDLVKDEKFCEMFIKEARAAGSLNHPNIIQVYDVGEESGQYFFSMEFASKGSVLEELGSKKSIGMPRAVKVIKDACNALDYAERKGLVHRDIKPDNLMVTEDNSVKLGDLGLAMSTQELQAEQDGVFGTPHYIAPEQAMGKPIDHRADIYALGATFYRMLTGRTLFTGATVKEILKKQVREPHPAITEHVPDCPQAISRIIDRMLAKNPVERYQHAQEIITDLSDWENLAARKAGAPGMAFGERPAGLGAEQSQHLAQINANKKLMIMGIAALVAILAAVFSVWYFVIRDEGAVATNTANTVATNTGNGSAANSTDVRLPPEVEEANGKIDAALNIVDFLVGSGVPKVGELKKAISELETALAENPRASDAKRKLATDKLDALKTQHDQLSKGATAVGEEWQDAFRDCEGKIKEFQYKAGGAIVEAFIKKYELSANEEILKVVEDAKDYFLVQYPASARNHLDNFRKSMLREIDDAKKSQDAALRAATAESVLGRVRDAETACDDEFYKGSLKKLGDDIDRELAIFKKQANDAEKKAIKEAFARCSTALAVVLETCRREVAKGDFKQVQQHTADFELSNSDYIAYKDREQFRPIVDDLNRRADQLKLEQQSLARLVSLDALPDVVDTNALLKDHPWPEDVARFLGGAKHMLILTVKQQVENLQWSMDIYDGRNPNPRKLSANDLDTREERVALASAITHLVTYHDGALAKLMQPVFKDGPPVLVGLFAWMAEMEAYEAAQPLIEHAWNNLPSADASRALVREYYAWGLLGKASALSARGDRAGAQLLINKLESEFADTRANKGRK
jgi:pSer/pThr/pTyr-binding forkhead associated (FHA) protein